MRCKSCQLLGHTLKHCKNPAACVSCNLAPHLLVACTRIFFANCNGDHPASSPSCPQYQTQKNLLHIKTSKKCSFREARMILKQQQNTTTNSTLTYSTVASQNPTAAPGKSDNTKAAKTTELLSSTSADSASCSTKAPTSDLPSHLSPHTSTLNPKEKVSTTPNSSEPEFTYLNPGNRFEKHLEKVRSYRLEVDNLLRQTNDDNTTMTSRSSSKESIASHAPNPQSVNNPIDSDTSMDDPDT